MEKADYEKEIKSIEWEIEDYRQNICKFHYFN